MPNTVSAVSQSGAGPTACALLLDRRSLRRRAFATILGDWLAQHELTLVELESGEWCEAQMPSDATCRIILFCIGGDSLDAALVEQLREAGSALPATPLVVIADNEHVPDIITAFKEGVRGYISTRAEPEEAKQVLSFILTGGSYFPPTSILELAEARQGDGNINGGEPPRNTLGLTCRQHDVLACIRQGKSNTVIARELSMRESTVKVHVRQILRKLGADNRTQAALVAAQLNAPAADEHVAEGAEMERAIWRRRLADAENALRLVADLPAKEDVRTLPKLAV